MYSFSMWIKNKEAANVMSIYDSKHGGGGALYTPSSLAFCLLLKISWGNPQLKILDLANLFDADAPKKKNLKI